MAKDRSKVSPVTSFDHGAGGSLEILAERKLELEEGKKPQRVLLVLVQYGDDQHLIGILPPAFRRLVKAKTLETFSRILTEDVLPLEEECALCSITLDEVDTDEIRKGSQEEIESAEAMLGGEPLCEKCAAIFEEDLDQEDKEDLMLERIAEIGRELKRKVDRPPVDDFDNDDEGEPIL